jgi:chromosomal replication initiation ATPase DnaA
VLLLAPHASTREWIEKRHLPAIQEVLSQLLGRSVVIHLRLARDFRAEVTASLDTTGRS